MRALFSNLLTASVSGSIVILAVLVLRLVLRKTPKKFICILWMVAGLRLLLPVPLQSRFSLQPPTIRLPQSETLQPYLVPLWCIVAVSLLCASLISYAHLRRQVKDARKIRGGWECEGLETAFVLGFLKPKIYIPAGVSDNTRQQILAHERTHLDKGDHWIKLIGFLALVLHWFNPLVWVSYILLCKDIEMACDQRVVQFMDLPERKAYSAALLDCSTHKVHYAACPVAFGEVSVKYRIKSVLSYKKPAFWISLLGVLAIALVAVCLGTNPVEKQKDPEAALVQSSQEDPADFSPRRAAPISRKSRLGHHPLRGRSDRHRRQADFENCAGILPHPRYHKGFRFPSGALERKQLGDRSCSRRQCGALSGNELRLLFGTGYHPEHL